MPNKLKEIFSDKMFDLGGKIYFQDNEAHRQFLNALQIVQDEGKPVEVKGITALTTVVRDGEMVYPFLEQKDFSQFIVAPSTEDVPIVVNTKHGEKTVLFKCYHTTNETVLETGENEIVYFKIVFIKGTPNITFTYRTQPQLAKTIKDIVESYNTTIALLNNLFKDDDKQELSDEYTFIHDTRESFIELESFFSRLYLIEQELGLSFSPAKIGDTENDEEELEELYLLLIEKKVIRLNAKLTATESTGITMKAGYNLPEAGSKLDITFISKIEYTMYGQKISVHTANLLSNAIVKQFEENEDGSKKILYDDTDSQPMYISYMGFKTIDEAKKEMSTIMEHKERYTDALTFNEYMSSKQKI